MSTPLVTHPIDTELLDRYLARLTTPEESEHVQRWMASHPDHILVVEALQRLPLEVNGGELTTDTEAWLARIDIRSRSPETGVAHRNVSVKGIGVLGRHPLRGGWHALAGAVLGAMIVIVGWHLSVLRLDVHQHTAMSAYVTGNGQRANITLPDGNTVALNVASRLEVPADYLAGNHTLRLTGEGLFTISHREKTPFTVLAGPAIARVLGTSFLVRHYATDNVTTVVVRDGKVAVHAARRPSVVLTAVQQVKVDRTGAAAVQVSDPTQFSFATGTLVLNGVPFPSAIVELDRWYDVDIRLGDSVLTTRRVAGEWTAGSVTDLSAILGWMFNVRVVRDGRVLTLFPR
ncbi:MAG TPA: FecR domain-containing protein [Gemmatimonadaceae bacterium]|jgi:ferric-dicitrate binding protein FerR (iron transport regulator)|nr:FecR domain-containing protein [Gemmatimonadaceae bacterium]